MSWVIKWNKLAIDDVAGYIEWIKRDSQYHSARVAKAIFDLVDDVPRHPLTGHIVPEIGLDNLRFKIIYGRRLIYEIRASDNVIVIKRLISCRMDFIKEYAKFDSDFM